ncbi:hypothetical protein HQ576_17120, partial [bacterium]|nr:hypothetical protein [bacterium]
MSACSRFGIVLCLVGYAAFCSAAGLEAVGNTDGVLTWHLGALAHGESKREVVLFAFDATPDKVARHLDAARHQLAKPTAASPAPESDATSTAWLDNGTTDFALEDTALFRWRSKRQALRGPHGGQLSQFTWYVHYRDRTGLRRAGTPHTDDGKPENLRVVEPVRRLSATAAACTLTTTDGRLRIRVRAMMGAGPTAAVEFLLANTSPEPLTDVRLSAYANIEAAHTHEGDYSVLDARTGGLLVYDPPTGACVVMAGLTRPATGHAGTWNSLPTLQAAAGTPIAQWRPVTGLTPALKQRLVRQSVPHDIHIPVVHANPTTPVTRTLSPAEAADALERDWLFQAMGEPLAQRAAKEVRWARELAQRLDAAAELAELAALEKRMAPAATPAGSAATPSWIWFPEGRPSEDAPAAARLFRRAFTLPPEADVRAAVLHVTADDSCEAFLNGTRVGTQDTWERVAVLDVTKRVHPGRNVLAVRAENKPFHAANPAGLIARLVVHLAGGTQLTVVTDASWRATATPHERWAHVAFDDSAWKPARIAAPFGQGPWGRIAGLMDGVSAADPAGRKLYFAVRRIKRRIALKNPVLRFRQLLFIDQPMPQGRECIHEAIHRMGINATPGGRLLVLDGLHPGGAVRQLAPERPGSFWRPDLSFDASRVLFCFKAHDEKSFHLYEMGLDGRNVRQLTHSDYDDVDPIYLPDGHIVFTSTRANSYVRCGPFIYSYVLARCDADGGNVYL